MKQTSQVYFTIVEIFLKLFQWGHGESQGPLDKVQIPALPLHRVHLCLELFQALLIACGMDHEGILCIFLPLQIQYDKIPCDQIF